MNSFPRPATIDKWVLVVPCRVGDEDHNGLSGPHQPQARGDRGCRSLFVVTSAPLPSQRGLLRRGDLHE